MGCEKRRGVEARSSGDEVVKASGSGDGERRRWGGARGQRLQAIPTREGFGKKGQGDSGVAPGGVGEVASAWWRRGKGGGVVQDETERRASTRWAVGRGGGVVKGFGALCPDPDGGERGVRVERVGGVGIGRG